MKDLGYIRCYDGVEIYNKQILVGIPWEQTEVTWIEISKIPVLDQVSLVKSDIRWSEHYAVGFTFGYFL